MSSNAFPSATDDSPGNKPRDDFEISLISDSAGRLSVAGPLQEILDEITRFVAILVECDSCFVYVLEAGELVLWASKILHSQGVDRVKMKLGQGITGWVAENRKPVVIAKHAYKDPRFKLFHELPEDRYEAFLSMPVISGGRVVGVINVQDRKPRAYSEREVSLISTIGFLFGAGVERARLENSKSQLIDRLETRTVVDQAKSILQRERMISEESAYRMLQRASQHKNKSMKEIAEAIILSDDLKRQIE